MQRHAGSDWMRLLRFLRFLLYIVGLILFGIVPFCHTNEPLRVGPAAIPSNPLSTSDLPTYPPPLTAYAQLGEDPAIITQYYGANGTTSHSRRFKYHRSIYPSRPG
jgi:hypothetical protein